MNLNFYIKQLQSWTYSLMIGVSAPTHCGQTEAINHSKPCHWFMNLAPPTRISPGASN